jgi:hypothetical protein
MYKLLAVPLVLLGLTGCAGGVFMGKGVAMGILYADATTPVHATENNVGKKKGEACATSILGLVTTGDATIRAAADAGGIKDIAAVDASIKNILGIVATYCTIVSGTG